MNRWIGRLLMTAAVVHSSVAVFLYHAVLSTIIDRGIYNTVAGAPEIGAVVWSLFFGAVAFVGGVAVTALESAEVAVPKSIGWCLLAIAVLGAVLMPISGFWLVFPAAIGILRQKSAS